MKHKNLIAAFEATVNKQPHKTCLRYVKHGEWKELSWQQFQQQIQTLALSLSRLGVSPGDRVAIWSKTRYEWTLIDMAVMASGAVLVPVYESVTADQGQYVLQDSRCSVVFVENSLQWHKIQTIRGELPDLKHVCVIEDGDHKDDTPLSSLLVDTEGDSPYQHFKDSLLPEDTATVMYTSGTTGNPKALLLKHQNFLAEVDDVLKTFHFGASDESLIFLPLAHILARMFQFVHLISGFVQSYAEGLERLSENIREVKPQFMISVPRIFEKIHTKVFQDIEKAPATKRAIFLWALGVGKRRAHKLLERKALGIGLQLQCALAHRLVFSKLHKKLGGRIRFFVSGGAPLSKDVALFFLAFGFKILEGYGLTETTAAITVNRLDHFKIGTVGKALPGVELKIAADGEILVRAEQVFEGYAHDQSATQEAFTADGWFCTGDVGHIDAEGFLTITDRKKDLIVTAGGKNIAPQNIENLLKTDVYISQVMVHGDKRKFLSALITLNQPEIEGWANSQGVSYQSYTDLLANPQIHHLIKTRIDAKSKELARYEQIKKFALLPHDFTVESGDLTPTLKVKRRVIEKKHAKTLDGFYED